MRSRLAWCVLAVVAALSNSPAFAGWGDEYAKRIRSTEVVSPLGDDVFGDSVKLFDGSVTFSATDIRIPGNNALPVELRRTLDLQDKSYPRALWDWQLDIPYIGGIFPDPYSQNLGCDQGLPPVSITIGGQQFLRKDYWHGMQLHVPGGGGSMLSDRTSSDPADEAKVPKPSFAVSKWRTKDGWFFQCIASPQGASHGYLGLAPDGTKYYFTQRVVRDHAPISKQNDPYHAAQMFRLDVRLYVTKIEDRFGNAVTYVWADNDLDKIQSSDGREIDLTYNATRIAGLPGYGDFGRLDSATAHGRTWNYQYTTVPNVGPILSSAVNPDGSAWTFSSTQFKGEIFYEPDPANGAGAVKHGPADGPCAWMPIFRTSANPVAAPGYPAGGGIYSITHPSGARADFTVLPKRHGRTNVPLACRHNEGGAKWEYNEPGLFHDVLSLTNKQVSGPALATGNTTYVYSGLNGDHAPYVNQPEYGTYTPTPTPHYKTVTVTDPDGRQAVHSFGKDYQLNEGRLLQTQIKQGGATYETITTTYLPEEEVAALPLPNRMGTLQVMGMDEYSAAAVRPVISRVTTRDSRTYTWQVITGCHGGSLRCLDGFGRPIYAQRFSTNGNRTDYFEYHDNTSLWVIGQPKRQVNADTGLEESKTDYNGNAQPWKRYRFGQLQETLTYHPSGSSQAGALSTVADGAGNTIALSNWKRGVPQSITYPTQLRQPGVFDTETAVVNDRGEIDSVTDELGYKTCYGYDLVGRLASVTHPSETQSGVCDASTWTQTVSSFVPVAASEYGLPAGHWRHSVTTGARKKETFYDALWRPVLTRESTTDGSAGVRAVRRTFDWSNRETFVSYPIASFVNYTDAVFNLGTDALYDPLGRVTGTAADSELGTLTTSTSYANGQTVHTNARGYSTTTTYQAFDEPSLESPLMITAPEGVTTVYTRDLFGKPVTLSRNGTYTPPGGVTENLSATRRFVYDPQQRLCKTIEPDAGITVLDYDAAGNVSWRAAGQAALTDPADCQRTSVAATDKSLSQYDALNRLLWINHPSDTSDVGYSYAADGAILTASVSQTGNTAAPPFVSPLNIWTYTYKRRRLLEKESLAVTGVAAPFELTWSYHARGEVAGLTYPSGHSVSFNPNAYGEPRQVGSYATNASYHPYGGLAGFTYGNATTRTLTPNTRQLPAQIVDVRSGTKWLDHTLTYDPNGNLKSLTDGVIDPEGQPSETRTLTYDQRDRLAGVAGVTGNETYAYDVLDNVRRTVIGGIDRRFQINATTQRLSLITTIGSVASVDHGWNDRGELTSRTTTTPSAPPAVVPPTIHRNGFEDPVLVGTESFSFDRARRLTATSQGAATYQYDAHNRRVASVLNVPGWGTRYQIYSRAGELLYVEDPGRNERTEFFHLDGTLVAERTRPMGSETATINYLHSDHRGTPTVKTSSGGSRVYRSRLMPYGTPYDGIYREGPGFTKHATDEVGPMSYMQQRYYDFGMMRFLSPDPVGVSADNFNRYAYANNNPYTFVDPDGRQALDQSAKFIDLNQRHGSNLDSMSAEMSAGHAQGVVMAVGTATMAPALAFVGTTAATVVADAAAGTWMGAIAVNGPAIVASTEIVAGTAAAIATGGGAPTPVSMTAAQASNVNRFASKLPAGNSGVAVDALGDGIVATASVPGRVPGSSAVYQKTIDASGQTSSYLKTTFDPKGSVVHIKDKIGGGNIDP